MTFSLLFLALPFALVKTGDSPLVNDPIEAGQKVATFINDIIYLNNKTKI